MLLLITIIMMEGPSGAEIDIFVPSFPDLQNTFIYPFMVELTLSTVGSLCDVACRWQSGETDMVVALILLLAFYNRQFILYLSTAYWQLLECRQGVGVSPLYYPTWFLQTSTQPKSNSN